MFKALRRRWRNSSATVDLLNQAVAGIANQTDLLNRRMDQLIAGIANQTDVLNRKLQENIAGITNLAHLVNRHGRLGPMQPGQLPQLPNSAQTPPQVMDRLSALLRKPNDNAGPARETAAAALADLCVSALSTGEDRVAFFDRLVATLLPLDHSRVFWGDRMLLLDKNMGFIEDAVFADAYNEIKDNKNFNQYRSPHTECWRLHLLAWAAQHALSLDGDFVECGVFKGDRASLLAKVTDFARQRKTFYLYDSFAGFSPTIPRPMIFQTHQASLTLPTSCFPSRDCSRR